ncbi:LCP family protein [Propioniciclava coleopterorum]|uniref:LCP family protein n=1 Tax=Propioniciclava coleopterorum TaxID=2714937 RepID=A0A6G7Y8Z0_9ACTN|nr:LCP family protein [Propioniciclava coleopterorum]QIK73179.1 LCP family protein [Propioniciclava coleopterorum]
MSGESAPSRPHDAERAIVPRPRRRARGRTFGSASALTIASALVPGLGLAWTRWRSFGLVLTLIAVGAAVAVALGATVARGWGLSVIASPTWLSGLAWALAAFGLAWVIAIVATQLLTRPRPARWWQRLFGALLVGVLSFAVVLPSAYGARTLFDTSQLVRDVFQDPDDPGGVVVPTFGNSADPWAHKPRLNVLILGADTGDDRVGTRTDTVMVASINTRTGDTVLFGLPRQTERLVFPQGSGLATIWPNGYHLAGEPDGEQMLNAMYENVVNHPGAKELIPASKDPGAKVLELAVGASLGLEIDYYVMANLEGFVEIIDALGGVTVNINRPVPVGGKNPSGGDPGFPPDRWLPPGPDQHLNGFDALWYARGRYHTDDYDRMRRQRCVIKALSRQVNLTTVLSNYEALTQAGRTVVQTDVPNSLLPALLDLATKVRTAPLRSVSFQDGHEGFSTGNPKWDVVRERVVASLDPPAVAPSGAPTASASPSGAPTASRTPTPARTTPTPARTTATPSAGGTATPGTATPGTPAPGAGDECSYNPEA